MYSDATLSGRNSLTFCRDLLLPSSAMKMEASVNFCLTAWYHIPEDCMLHSPCCEVVISLKLLTCSKFTYVTTANTTFAKLQKVTLSFVTSVRPSTHLFAWNSFAPTGWILIKFNI
jgi:hypothetical protein